MVNQGSARQTRVARHFAMGMKNEAIPAGSFCRRPNRLRINRFLNRPCSNSASDCSPSAYCQTQTPIPASLLDHCQHPLDDSEYHPDRGSDRHSCTAWAACILVRLGRACWADSITTLNGWMPLISKRLFHSKKISPSVSVCALKQAQMLLLIRIPTIDNAKVTVQTGGLNIQNASTTIVMPANTNLPVNLDLCVPVSTTVTVAMKCELWIFHCRPPISTCDFSALRTRLSRGLLSC